MTTFSEVREECYRWATFDYDADVDKEPENNYKAHLLELDVLLAAQAACKRKLESGGRNKRRPQYLKAAHKRIIKDYSGYKEVIDEKGFVINKKESARFRKSKFHHRFRMSPKVFQKNHDDITDPKIGCRFF